MPSTARVSRRIAIALSAIALVGCGPTLREAATTSFLSRHPGCHATALRPRAELSRPNMTVFEVAGCNAVEVVPCFPSQIIAEGIEDGHLDNTDRPATCLAPDWCDPTGCNTVELAVRHKFAADLTCPVERVTAVPHDPVVAAPPAEIATDAERRRMWEQAHAEEIARERAAVFLTATGCGEEATYECWRGGDSGYYIEASGSFSYAPNCQAVASDARKRTGQ